MNWNEFFGRGSDDMPPRPRGHAGRARTYDDFENDYKKLFGVWLDHHYLQLIREHGSEEATRMMDANVEKLNEFVRRRGEAEKAAHEFHAVPEDVEVPF